jgi:hypothetical protein
MYSIFVKFRHDLNNLKNELKIAGEAGGQSVRIDLIDRT